MTALAANKATATRSGRIARVAVAASQTIYQGALLEITTGKVSPASKAANKTYWGIAQQYAKTGASDTAVIETELGATAHFAGDGTLDTAAEKLAAVGGKAYVVDDQTVTTTAAGATACGVIVDYDDDGVWVKLDN